jgi:hypothetical protein
MPFRLRPKDKGRLSTGPLFSPGACRRRINTKGFKACGGYLFASLDASENINLVSRPLDGHRLRDMLAILARPRPRTMTASSLPGHGRPRSLRTRYGLLSKLPNAWGAVSRRPRPRQRFLKLTAFPGFTIPMPLPAIWASPTCNVLPLRSPLSVPATSRNDSGKSSGGIRRTWPRSVGAARSECDHNPSLYPQPNPGRNWA